MLTPVLDCIRWLGSASYAARSRRTSARSATARLPHAYDPTIADLALALREIILEEAPDASESVYQVYTVAIWFGFSGKMKDMFCYITTHAGHINLGLPARRDRFPIRTACWRARARRCGISRFRTYERSGTALRTALSSRRRSNRWVRPPRQAELERLL